MKVVSFKNNVQFNDDRVVVNLLQETPFSKEIQILLKENLTMKEHTAPFPIIVQVLQGEIKFGVNGESIVMQDGDLITLEANVPHDLKAVKDSIVRLSLSKRDKTERVENVSSSAN